MSKKVNIILFLNSFWNNGQGLSGGDQIVIQVYKRIHQKLNIIHCFTSPSGEKIIPTSINNIKFQLSKTNWDKLPIAFNYLLRTLKALSCIRIKNVDVIHSSSDFLPDILPALIYKIFHPQTKWVVNVMHIYPDWSKRPGNKVVNFLAASMQKISFVLIRKSDTIITLNQQVKNELVSLGHENTKIIIIPAGIDYDFIDQVRINKSLRPYDVTFMARLKPSKGIFDLIKIWQHLISINPKLQLAVIGGGGDLATIKNFKDEIKQYHLVKHLKILGYLSDHEAFGYIKNSQVFVLPSHEEGFGIVIAEALACGTPVIVWDLPIYPEIYGRSITYVKENDYLGFAQTINQLIRHKNSQKLLSQKAKRYAQKFSWDQVATQYQSVFTT